jgi:hypothetical protein
VIRSQSPCRAIIHRAARKGSIASPLTKALLPSVDRILEVEGRYDYSGRSDVMDGGRAGGQPVTVGTVREIWRYPVKSMAGERLD